VKYRKFGSTDFDVSVLSFGAHRLPLTNRDESIKMLHYAIDNGVNCIDLGYPYDPKLYEQRARLVSEALQGTCRERVKIAVTLPIMLVSSVSHLDRFLGKNLQLLQIDKVDFCILGELNRKTWPKLNSIEWSEWINKAIESGKIDEVGFSFHDDFQFLKEIVMAYEGWSFCKLRYSYMDVDHHPGTVGLKYAAEKGLAVIVAEPFKGGRLVKPPPEPVAKAWGKLLEKRSLAEWGLLWVWNHSEVSTVVVGMEKMKDVIENVSLADEAEANKLDIWELITFSQVKDAYLKLKPINCATCYCCMPCPVEIDVPRIFEIYNDAVMYEDVKTARFYYHVEQHDVKKCIECYKCENSCPRKIPIVKWLKTIQEALEA